MNEDIYGQMSIYDFAPEQSPRYTFKRYIGQSVVHRCGVVGVITKIEPYYTTFVDFQGKEYTGTPYDLQQFEPQIDDYKIRKGLAIPVEFEEVNE